MLSLCAIFAVTLTNCTDVMSCIFAQRTGDSFDLTGQVIVNDNNGDPVLNMTDATGGTKVMGVRHVIKTLPFKSGDIIRATGVIDIPPDSRVKAPSVICRSVRRVATGTLPPPVDVSAADVLSGRYECRVVRVRGRIRRIFCDEIAAMAGDNSLHTIARKGEYMLCDKSVGNTVKHTIFQCPNKMGKGVLVTQTVDGNLLIGPSAIDIEDKENTDTTASTLASILETAKKSVPSLTTREVITSFAGLRAHLECDDFIIEKSKANDKFINVAGIESPGLSSAPAVGLYVADMIVSDCGAEEKSDFNPVREAPVRFRHLSNEERKALVEKNPAYGRIICRCETITEGEILDAIRAPAGARDVDGVKRRTRAGMGRCQGGFCGSKVVELLAKELGVDINEITKFGGESKILYERTK